VKYILRVFVYLRPYWKSVIVAVAATIAIALVGLLIPWPLTILIDSVLGDHPLPTILAQPLGPLAKDRFSMLVFVVAVELIIALTVNGLNVLNEYVQTKLTQNMGVDFRGDIFNHAQHLSLAYHAHGRPGQLVYSINVEAEVVIQLLLVILPLAESLITIVGVVLIVFLIDWRLALLALVVVPFMYYLVRYYTKYIPGWLRTANDIGTQLLQMIHESISMLPVIVAFGREDYEYQRYRIRGKDSIDAYLKVTVRQTVFSLVVNMTTVFGTALVLGFGAFQALQGQLTAGQLLVVLAYVAAVYKPLETISTTIGALQNQVASLQLAFGVLDTAPEIVDQPEALPLPRVHGQLRYEAVDFHYANRPAALTDISFTAQAGQTIALVGPTGAGKTTLVSLLSRFYEPQQGRILIDDHDIRTVTLHSLRNQISVVAQDPLLFAASIADNIRYGRLDATMDEVIAAAQAAAAHDFIVQLPQQYQTPVGERGAQLSGGERQRICVARAFLKDAPILILDEPTSAIDSQTEAVILEALERLMVGRTTLMVAHRLSTIRNADLILVLQHGRLVAQGSHEELLARDGMYKQLYDAQTLPARRPTQPVPVAPPSQ
jgi:ATP-binding cassette, subfamily B, bacterial